MLYAGHSKSCRNSKLAFVQNPVVSPLKDSQAIVSKAPQASSQIAPQKAPQPTNIRFLDPSLQHNFPELCLFHNVDIFCDRIELCKSKFREADILELLPKCLRGEALTWFRSQSKYRYLAECLRALKARFLLQALPQEAPQEAPQAMSQSVYQSPEYHHCKLCNASFSSVTRLMQYAQENICNKPRCRHCEMVFSSKNRLHQHLREKCQKQLHRKSSTRSSSSSLSACSPTCSPPISLLPEENRASPPPSQIASPPPTYQAISPPPPTYKTYLTVADLTARYATPTYLKVDDLYHMFGGPSATTATTATTKSSTTITIIIDDPLVRPFVTFKKSKGSTQIWELGMATSHHQITRAQCSTPRCRRPPLLNTGKRQAIPNPA